MYSEPFVLKFGFECGDLNFLELKKLSSNTGKVKPKKDKRRKERKQGVRPTIPCHHTNGLITSLDHKTTFNCSLSN